MDAKTVHFIGVCGAGMSAVAKLLRDSGWRVSGSDQGFYPPVSDFLTREGLPCATPHAPENIPADASLIVIGKHAKLTPEHNSEVKRAFELRAQGAARIASYPDILNELTKQTENIVVAGSYGKSTTTTLIAWTLAHSGADPSYFIGAIPVDFQANAHKGAGRYFVLEGDEYPSANWDASPKFLHYNASAVVLVSCEHDHFNEFPTEEDYLAPYQTLVRRLSPASLLMACADGKLVDRAVAEAKCRVVSYSGVAHPTADWFVSEAHSAEDAQRFVIQKRKANGVALSIPIETKLLGEHNRQNIVGCVATLLESGALEISQIQSAISAFRGIRRRLELKSEASSVYLYEDLSSSRPKAIAALHALRQSRPESRIYAIFQPHTFSFRSRQALEWYPGMFAEADEVLVFSPPELRGLLDGEMLSHDEIIAAIREGNPLPVHVVRNAEDILDALLPVLKAGDVAAFMTSGGMEGAIASTIDRIVQEFPRK